MQLQSNFSEFCALSVSALSLSLSMPSALDELYNKALKDNCLFWHLQASKQSTGEGVIKCAAYFKMISCRVKPLRWIFQAYLRVLS